MNSPTTDEARLLALAEWRPSPTRAMVSARRDVFFEITFPRIVDHCENAKAGFAGNSLFIQRRAGMLAKPPAKTRVAAPCDHAGIVNDHVGSPLFQGCHTVRGLLNSGPKLFQPNILRALTKGTDAP